MQDHQAARGFLPSPLKGACAMMKPSFRNKFYNGITKDIERNSRSIISVFATEDDVGPPFAYTIGNAVNRRS
jgi:hypothetical protein